MDTTRNITYRDFVLNDEDIQESIVGGGASGTGISGCTVDTFDITDVDVVQWMEKRSQADGSDAGDVFFGPRRIRMAGTLYATTRLTLFDDLFSLRAALNPVLAQREEPLDKGYRPLYFTVPTNRADDYPSGTIDLMVRALPRGVQHVTQRDSLGGEDNEALAIPWQATFICKDPGIYSALPVEVEFDNNPTAKAGATIGTNNVITKASHGLVAGNRVRFYSLTGGTGLSTSINYYVIAGSLTDDTFKVSLTSGGSEVDVTVAYSDAAFVKATTYSGTWNNRGTYLGKFDALFYVGSGSGSISATVGDSVFTITLPASTNRRLVRLKSDKLVTIEEVDTNGETVTAEDLAMSITTFSGENDYPLIATGETAYSITFHGMAGVYDGGRMWFYEQYA